MVFYVIEELSKYFFMKKNWKNFWGHNTEYAEFLKNIYKCLWVE